MQSKSIKNVGKKVCIILELTTKAETLKGNRKDLPTTQD